MVVVVTGISLEEVEMVLVTEAVVDLEEEEKEQMAVEEDLVVVVLVMVVLVMV